MTDLEIFTCEQGEPEWFACRLGIPTASKFADILTKGRGSEPSKTRRTYMLKLLGERITGEIQDVFKNEHMERGHAMEPEVRHLYAMLTDTAPEQVGFMRRGRAGASPDSLVGDNGLLEIKTKLPHLQLECLLADEIPSEHYAQVQGQLWISGREWCDFVSYWPAMPVFIKRVYRDDAFIATLASEVERFNSDMDALHMQITSNAAIAAPKEA